MLLFYVSLLNIIDIRIRTPRLDTGQDVHCFPPSRLQYCPPCTRISLSSVQSHPSSRVPRRSQTHRTCRGTLSQWSDLHRLNSKIIIITFLWPFASVFPAIFNVFPIIFDVPSAVFRHFPGYFRRFFWIFWTLLDLFCLPRRGLRHAKSLPSLGSLKCVVIIALYHYWYLDLQLELPSTDIDLALSTGIVLSWDARHTVWRPRLNY